MMESYGAEVFPSPSDKTEVGKSFLKQDSNHPGSLGIAISEAIEDCLTHENTKYSLGSVLNHVLLHQTVVGLEAKRQMEIIDEYPDYVIGCIGGGSNYAGLAYPFMHDKLKGSRKDTVFVAVEPKAVPSTTRGVYAYDYGDTAKLTPLLRMFTIGHTFAPPPIHAGGLRYHGMAPTISLLIKEGYMQSVAYYQTEVLEAALLFAKTEGILVAPETAHAVKAAIDIAIKCKEKGEGKTILFNLSGHGLLDLKAFDDYLTGSLIDFEATEETLEKGKSALPEVTVK
jgi:tryptophan synthase beta chain